MKTFRAFIHDESGVTTTRLSLIAGLIGAALVATLTSIGAMADTDPAIARSELNEL